jgi:hypothetical protein
VRPAPSFQLRLFRLPLRNNADKAVAAAFEEFARRKGRNPYGLGDALAYVGRRAPELRVAFAKTHSHRGSPAT